MLRFLVRLPAKLSLLLAGATCFPLLLATVFTLPRGREVLAVRVVAFGKRRGPASEARELYEIVAGNSLDP